VSRMGTGHNIRALRQAAGWTQADLGREIGVSGAAVSAWERGDGKPETDNLEALSRLFRVSMEEIRREGAPPVGLPPERRQGSFDPVEVGCAVAEQIMLELDYGPEAAQAVAAVVEVAFAAARAARRMQPPEAARTIIRSEMASIRARYPRE
jgi:transcriptional regulator with XRE-family HTH domain